MPFPKMAVMIDEDAGVSLGILHKIIRNPNGEDIPVYDFKVYYHYINTLIKDEIDKEAYVDEIE